MEVASPIVTSTIHSAFLNENIGDNIKISESSFKILKEKDTEYLLVNIGVIDSSIKKYYYIMPKKKKETDHITEILVCKIVKMRFCFFWMEIWLFRK